MSTATLVVTLVALVAQALHAPARTVVTVDAGAAVAPVPEGLVALRDKYAAAVNTADAAALGALYAPDALVVVADGVVLRGATDIGRYFHDAFSARSEGATVTLQPQNFSLEDGVASETGGFSESRTGEPQPTTTGVYVTIYTRNAAGEWRIAMELRTRGRDKQLVRW